jgi:hypothetical protein
LVRSIDQDHQFPLRSIFFHIAMRLNDLVKAKNVVDAHFIPTGFHTFNNVL